MKAAKKERCKMLINQTAVKRLALDLAQGKRDRVGRKFLSHIEAKVREIVSERVEFHDNKCGTRRTLV